MSTRSPSPRAPRNPRDFNDPRNKPRNEAPNGRMDRDRPDRAPRFERNTEDGRAPRTDRPAWAGRGDRFGSNRERSERERFPRERAETGDRPRPMRGAGLLAELKSLDQELLKLIAKRTRMLGRLPNIGTSDHERELRTSWEQNATALSRDPRLIRQLFALLQEVEVIPADMEQPVAFTLSPACKPVQITLPAPVSDRLPRLQMVLAAGSAGVCTLTNVPINDPVIECLKALNQVGANLRWEEDGRILCQEGIPVAGQTKTILNKVIHVGDDSLNLYLMLFMMATRPARLKIIGESGLKFVDLAAVRHFLPLLGARLTNMVPGQEGLPVRLESSALLPSELVVPAALPDDAVTALLMATPGWDREVTIRLGEHPAGQRILGEALPILQKAGMQITVKEHSEPGKESVLDVVILPGKVVPQPESLLDLPVAVALLAMPAFVGGSVCLRGAWEATEQRQKTECEAVRKLFADLGLSLEGSNDAVRINVAAGAGDDAAGGKKQELSLKTLTDISWLTPELFPFGLVLSLLSVLQRKGGTLPALPEKTDMVLVDSFLQQLGLAREGMALTLMEPSSAPWASPSLHWALALSLAAFMRPQLRLSNPGIVLSRLPYYWNVYNTLPTPSLAPKAEEETPVSSGRPARRRVLAQYTPESEMPDEIVYPDED